MAWANGTKLFVYERQNGQCAVCGEPIEYKDMILHHIQNRKNGGSSENWNAQGRCRECEAICHRIHKNGNPTQSEFWEAKQKGDDTIAENYYYYRRAKSKRSRVLHCHRGATRW